VLAIPKLEQERNTFINNIIAKEPLIALEKLEGTLKDSGLFGMTSKDKVVVLHRQYAYLVLQRYIYA
jgi:hypothetical protein